MRSLPHLGSGSAVMSGPPPDGIQWPSRSTVRIGWVRFVGPFAWLVAVPLAVGGALCELVHIAVEEWEKQA